MARQENSVQFSLKELVQLESDRRQGEELKAQQRREEEARQRAESEAKARQQLVRAQAQRAAEEAAMKARAEAEVMLSAERARIAKESVPVVVPVSARPARSNTWMGFAAMALSVFGLGTSLLYIASQPTATSVKVTEQPISITKIEQVAAPADPVVIETSDVKGTTTTKVVKKKSIKETPKPSCNPKTDPLCGVKSSGVY